jgi:hypothetical protein
MGLGTEGKLAASRGKFRVIGVDTFPEPEEHWLVGDFGTLDEARKVAAKHRKQSAGNGNLLRFHIYDDKGRWVDEARLMQSSKAASSGGK